MVKKDLIMRIHQFRGVNKATVNSSVNSIIVNDKILRQNLLTTASPIVYANFKVQDLTQTQIVAWRMQGFIPQDPSPPAPKQEFQNMFEFLNNS